MQERPGRLLPSVIVGGLLLSGLALGAGSASAAVGDTCTVGTTTYKILDADYSKDGAGDCVGPTGLTLTAALLGDATGKLEKVVAQAADEASSVGTGAGSTPPSGPNPPAGSGGAASPTAPTAPGAKTPAPKPAARPAPAPLVAAPAAAPALAPGRLGAAGPVGALPALAGVAPAGLASSLFSANTYDPGLLFGSPLGNAASALFSPKPDSAVTTVSQAQALNAPTGNGYGTPATIGVIILACLVGFAVRHRVISRMKSREVPVDHEPRHAAPEVDETQAPEDARTMVVLTSR